MSSLADECPDPEDIGRAGWTILHTTAAAYPARPTQDQKRRMWDFMNSWSHVYPCTHCAAHMRVQMKKDLPDVSGKEGLSLWVCRLHNEVNRRLDKSEFPCDFNQLLERWHPTYPNIDGTDQPGGMKDIPPFATQKQHAAPAGGPAQAMDADLQSLMDMQCSAFCPKDEKKKIF